MRPVHTFSVVPSLPPTIEGLRTVAYDLRWCWSHESIELFRRLDRIYGKKQDIILCSFSAPSNR